MAMEDILQKPKTITRFEPDPRWALPKTLLGLEFEYEGVYGPLDNNDPHWSFWEMHRDDSLKDHGQEFTFRVPLFGIDAYNAIQWLMDQAQKNKYKCSSRCGIHVHLDVREMETSQWVGFVILYTILEPILFNWIGDNRENSIYCLPFYKADESLREACACVRAALDDDTKDTSTILRTAKNFARYAALNLQALAKFGSVEFRHLKTTHDFERVHNWINMIMCLRTATERFPTSDGAILALAQRLPAEEFLRLVFGEKLADRLWTPDVPNLLKDKGFPTARDLVLFGLTKEPWDGFKPPKGKHAGFEKFLKSLPDLATASKQEKLLITPRPRRAVPPRFTIDAPIPADLQQRARELQNTPEWWRATEPPWPGLDPVAPAPIVEDAPQEQAERLQEQAERDVNARIRVVDEEVRIDEGAMARAERRLREMQELRERERLRQELERAALDRAIQAINPR